MDLFVWTDPVAPSFARITLSGPSDRSFIVWFSQKSEWDANVYITAHDFITRYSNDPEYPASGYVVNPTVASGGEIFLDRTPNASISFPFAYPTNYATWYTQNSTITDFAIDGDAGTASITFERAAVTTDVEDWAFDFANLLDEFSVCYMIAYQKGRPKIPASGSEFKGCVRINSESAIVLPSEYVEGNC